MIFEIYLLYQLVDKYYNFDEIFECDKMTMENLKNSCELQKVIFFNRTNLYHKIKNLNI